MIIFQYKAILTYSDSDFAECEYNQQSPQHLELQVDDKSPSGDLIPHFLEISQIETKFFHKILQKMF